MIKKILVAALVLFTISCEKENDSFLIKGKIDSFYSGRKIKLVKLDRIKTVTIDSTIITNGKLELKGSVESPDLYYIFIDNYKGSFPLIVENETMNIEFNKDTIANSIVTGSKENDIFKIYQDFAKPLRDQNAKLNQQFRVAQANNDMQTMQQIRAKYDSLVKVNNDKSIENIKKYNNAAISAVMLEDFLNAKVVTAKEAEEIYNTFTQDVKNTRSGKEIKRIVDATIATEIGSVAPEFSGTTPEGKTIALNDIRGKVTIVDFWASWCGPCRKENPNVVKVYNKYHEKGLEIIGISLDGNKRQNNPKEAWLKAIETDSLDWHHVSNLQYFNDPIAKLYNINAIPATFILDENGKIVAKNLRGPALEQKISELLD
ncbi:TlpA disulfide reductase family protein [Hanstruepera flava]|uniref:TlpA disulfide reductase family protein n=1 Tax=Hanstruepera flava TaxID=2930218 RepID=UPI0020284647|nr:TlpA disulfide reductase family protein [Hanstruepera flava]